MDCSEKLRTCFISNEFNNSQFEFSGIISTSKLSHVDCVRLAWRISGLRRDPGWDHLCQLTAKPRKISMTEECLRMTHFRVSIYLPRFLCVWRSVCPRYLFPVTNIAAISNCKINSGKEQTTFVSFCEICIWIIFLLLLRA